MRGGYGIPLPSVGLIFFEFFRLNRLIDPVGPEKILSLVRPSPFSCLIGCRRTFLNGGTFFWDHGVFLTNRGFSAWQAEQWERRAAPRSL